MIGMVLATALALGSAQLAEGANGNGLTERAAEAIEAASQQQREARAKQLFVEGTQAYNLGDFKAALVAYETAYALRPLPAFLFNIGQCHFHLAQYERAIFFYQGYLREAPAGGAQAVVKERLAEAERLRSAVVDQARLEQQRALEAESRARAEVERKKLAEARALAEEQARAEAEKRAREKQRIDAERERALRRQEAESAARQRTLIIWGSVGGVSAAAVAVVLTAAVLTGSAWAIAESRSLGVVDTR